MLLLATLWVVLLLVPSPVLSSDSDSSSTCAKSCVCLGPWAKCIGGKVEDLAGHFGPQTESVSLQHYNVRVIEANAFSEFKLPNFWKLDIVQCGVVTIKKNAFSGLQDLLSLHLDNNEIETIEAGAFFSVLKLTSLSLQHNKLKTLEYGMFEGLKSLNSLNLNNNLLKNLTSKIFEKAQTLSTILLKENLIENINSSFLEGLNKAAQLYVKKNPLVCNCALKKELPVLQGRIIGATCSSPRNLEGRGWKALQDVNCDHSEDN
jgi:Leucine-rich repeat (LRR) protein